mmetsp:Transcript_107706/g.299459  ORF Transcript_107706/g.299459 Transcript_107706/m.299459 type:complete len:270 (+) Transcript_107706:46-855(+)
MRRRFVRPPIIARHATPARRAPSLPQAVCCAATRSAARAHPCGTGARPSLRLTHARATSRAVGCERPRSRSPRGPRPGRTRRIRRVRAAALAHPKPRQRSGAKPRPPNPTASAASPRSRPHPTHPARRLGPPSAQQIPGQGVLLRRQVLRPGAPRRRREQRVGHVVGVEDLPELHGGPHTGAGRRGRQGHEVRLEVRGRKAPEPEHRHRHQAAQAEHGVLDVPVQHRGRGGLHGQHARRHVRGGAGGRRALGEQHQTLVPLNDRPQRQR